jgi:hypothetical protein
MFDKSMLLLPLLAIACAGGDQTELISFYDAPGSMRIDGDPSEEPLDAPEFAGFVSEAEHEAYCAMYPDAAVCSNLGTSRQAWSSAEYYGLGHENKPCYSASGTPGLCRFPVLKQMRVVVTNTQCFDDPNITITEYAAVLDGFRDGVLSLNGAGTGVVVSTTSTSSHRLSIDCIPSSNTKDLGLGGFSGFEHTQIRNLPVGPHGQDEGAAVQVDGSTATVSPTNIKAQLIRCGLAGTPSQMRARAQYLGVHEGLHALGFAHFTTGVMRPTSICSDLGIVPVAQGFRTALSIYSGSTSGGVNIVDTGLGASGP